MQFTYAKAKARMAMLNRISVAGLVLGLVWAGIASAQHFNEPDAPCKNYQVTTQLEECFSLAIQSADSELNQLYRKIQDVLSPDEREQLKAVEKLWIKYRNASCAAERDLYKGGTAAEPAELACMQAEDRSRIRTLKATYGWRLDKFGP